ncbi:MAG: TIGR00341 family protein [Desulfobulbaceae bacterium]|nr:TIGR00341 family protein [Desulfobulbaceae bacterium]
MKSTENPSDGHHPTNTPTVAIVVKKQENLVSLISTGLATAKMHHGTLTVFFVTPSDDTPDWFSLPAEYDSATIVQQSITGKNYVRLLIKQLAVLKPVLLGMALDEKDGEDRYLAGKAYEPVLQQLNCPVYLVKSAADWSLSDSLSAFVPFWDDKNTRFAITAALEVSPKLRITACKVVAPSADEHERLMQQEEFKKQTKHWEKDSQVQTRLLYSFNEQQALLKEAGNYDFLLTGVGKGNNLTRAIFGDFRNDLINRTTHPAIILREYQGRAGSVLSRAWSLFDCLLPTLTREDRIEAYRMIRQGGRPNRDFYSMIALSASIASLGLILDSAAVIIGAMLVAPLMSAIIGMGMASIQGDLRFLRLTLRATLLGSAIAIMAGFCFGLINFHGDTTHQILQRTNPSTLDLVVALVSGIAAAYALCRKNVSNSLPGVAIAVALVPPLSTVGVCLSIGFWGLAWGALKLFLSNMVAIVFASALVFASFGFKPNLDTLKDDRRLKVFQRSFVASGILVLVMFVLLVSRTVHDMHEAAFDDEVQVELTQHLDDLGIEAEVDDWSITTTKKGVFRLAVQLESPRQISQKEVAVLEKKLEESLEKSVELDLTVIPVMRMHTQ